MLIISVYLLLFYKDYPYHSKNFEPGALSDPASLAASPGYRKNFLYSL